MTGQPRPAPDPATREAGSEAWLPYRALAATLAADSHQLLEVRGELLRLGMVGEAALVDGLHADLYGDPVRARRHFARAAAIGTRVQPPVSELAMVCEAQLLDAFGDPPAALERLHEAVIATEPHRNGMPFLGWSRHGTPIAPLLARLAVTHASPWLSLLVATAYASPDLVRLFAPDTGDSEATRSGVPSLSPRERDVLAELARGSTYADIAATLVIAESTVKTHVSSLYAKLGVSRRSEALAAARGLRLL